MNLQFHKRKPILVALACGGVVALAKDVTAGVATLYAFALTPQGAAAVHVATLLIVIAILAAFVLRR